MGSSSSADRAARRAEEREEQRRREIERGTEEVRSIFRNQFSPDFYNQVQQSYLDYYRPQLESQYDDYSEGLIYSLGRQGLLNSSVRGDKEADLQEQYDIQRQGLVERAINSANQRRQAVSGAQSDIISLLQVTGDAEGAATDAGAQAYNLSQQEGYDPLGQVFTDATYGLATQADLERRNQARFNTPLPGGNPTTSSGSGTTVG